MSSSFDIFISWAFDGNHEVFFSLTKSKLNFYLLRSRFQKHRSLPCRRLQPTQARGGGCCHFVCTQWLFYHYVCRKNASRQEEAWRPWTGTQEKAAAPVLQGTLDVSRETALSRGSSKVWQGKVEGDCQDSHDSVSLSDVQWLEHLLVVGCLLGFQQMDRSVAALGEKRFIPSLLVHF